MKVLYDYQIFNIQKIGGISRYFYELITYFDKDETVNWELPVKYSSNIYLEKHSFFKNQLLANPLQFKDNQGLISKANFVREKLEYKFKNMLYHNQYYGTEYVKNKTISIEKLKEGNFDVFHPTYFDDYFLDYIGDKPFVLTVHDLINQVFPEISLHHPIDKNKKMIARADRIITVSESTKRDLIDIFNVNEEKVDIVYLANPLEGIYSEVSDTFKQKIPDRYLLFVGGRWDYKNFLFFAQMFSSLIISEPDINVVCTGSPFNSSELFLFNKLGITYSFFNVFVSDDELVYLYKNAVAFVYPSMYEGFGLPILEAFSNGCPVVASNSSSLPEVGGDASLYFEPKNPGSILRALEKIVKSPALREENIAKGFEQLKKFSWEQTSKQTKLVYEKALA